MNMQDIHPPPAAHKARPKVLLVATHPIQYQIPLFRALDVCDDIDFSVLFIQLPSAQQQGVGFGIDFTWDIPLLEGYRWQRVDRVLGRGGLAGFFATRLANPFGLLKQHTPDVLILTGWHAWPLCQLLLAASLARIPVVMRGESNALQRRRWHVRLLHRALLSRCAAFLSIGKGNSAFYRSYGVQANRLFDTAYFVDNDRFLSTANNMEGQRTALRQRWQIPNDAVCFCFAGKLEPKKRVLDLLDGLRKAVQPGKAPLHVLLVGTGEQMEAAQQVVQRHQLPVTFAGFLNQSEIPAAYVAADCLVLPSDFGETWGLVVNEAMASGRPAIVSDRVGCNLDLIRVGETGLVFPFGDSTALAACMRQLADDAEARLRMGASARALVCARYTVDNARQGVQAAVRSVVPST